RRAWAPPLLVRVPAEVEPGVQAAGQVLDHLVGRGSARRADGEGHVPVTEGPRLRPKAVPRLLLAAVGVLVHPQDHGAGPGPPRHEAVAVRPPLLAERRQQAAGRDLAGPDARAVRIRRLVVELPGDVR